MSNDANRRLRRVRAERDCYREALENVDVALSYLDATPLDDPVARAAHLESARDAVAAACGEPHECWRCSTPMPQGTVIPPPGWALRADLKVAACPQHLEFMPPHPAAFAPKAPHGG